MQQKHLHLIEAIVLTSSLVVPVRAQYPGSDGSATGPVRNTVPCRHATGNWGDSLGNTYNITTSLVNNTVAGSASVVGEPGCPRVGYTVSGSITPVGGANFLQRGTTTYNIHLTNPSYASCGGLINVNVDLSGDFRNDGCDIGFGPWHNVDNSGSGTLSLAKPADLPTGEATEAVGWSSVWPTVQQWRQTLQGDAFRPFDGRQVKEVAGPSKVDGCYYAGAAASGYAQFGVTGGWWLVGRYATPPLYFYSNRWIDDYVGFLPGLVTFYRNNGRAPCDANAQQLMNICTNGNSCGNSQQYFSNFISGAITATTVSSGRANQIQLRAY